MNLEETRLGYAGGEIISKNEKYAEIINWIIVFLVSIWIFFLYESVKYGEKIDFGFLELLILLIIITKYIHSRKYQISINFNPIITIHGTFFGLFFVELFNQNINDTWPSKIWPDSVLIVICYSSIIFLKYISYFSEEYFSFANTLIVFGIITNSILNILDPYIENIHIDILRICISILAILFFELNLEINQKNIIPMVLGIFVGWITYFGMVNGWIRFIGEEYEIPMSVKIIYGSILMILLPWMAYISESNEN